MNIIQITVIGIVATILAITLRKNIPEFAFLVALAASVLIFLLILPSLSAVIELLKEISSNIEIDRGYIAIVLKVIGIAYLAEFGMQLCEDAGEGVIAKKIELAGKIMIMVTSAPVLLALMTTILRLY